MPPGGRTHARHGTGARQRRTAPKSTTPKQSALARAGSGRFCLKQADQRRGRVVISSIDSAPCATAGIFLMPPQIQTPRSVMRSNIRIE